ncbi:serine/threonine protein kinase [Streptomyces aquilus]|uniref:non-specific serine/threonine protein kinase n=1 Tax=Streptomyces aquilus TaxID=2548456 RepID=A0A3S9ICD4_9ACTN|nr:serine/threonine-protein kinase [Streptomyces aquilus]AZP21998.1 serine/threonine protein kinase [Streptomyces aquilus]
MHSVERIGRYRVQRRLGAGAFGTVWLAHDDTLDAPVAVKVLADNWSHRLDVRERFLAEARLLRRAASRRVVQVHDIGELPDGRPYFVMEYADGGTLADLLDDGPLPVDEALRLTAAAALGAAALHEAGIVHRDIKPSNLLLRTGTSGDAGARQVLLADLGLAKILAEASGLTLAAGSAGYRPPEQAEPGTGIDARADVYSLGAVGYQLVTGVVPAAPGKVVRPDRLRPGLDPGVRRALLRALRPDRARRWPDARTFAAELERLGRVAKVPSSARRAGRAASGACSRRAGRKPSHWLYVGFRPVRRECVPGVGRQAALSPYALVADRRPRRWPALLAGTAVTAALIGATFALWPHGSAPAGRRIEDVTGRVSAEVPAAWAGQVRDAGWDPAVLGLRAGHEPGFAVADDLARWPDLRAGVDGVFVGVLEHGDVTAVVNDRAHPECHYDGARDRTLAAGHGRVRSWSDCPGGGSVVEAGLTPPDGGGRPQVYVQIRTAGGGPAARDVLDSVRVGD